MPELVCKKVRFYAPHDEEAFFEWLDKIEAIKQVWGLGDEIHLTIKNEFIDDESLRDFIAIFTRCEIELSQLSQFRNKANEDWFYSNKQAFWRKGVFGEQ